MSEDAIIRSKIDRQLRPETPLRDKEWEYLVDEGYIGEYKHPDYNVEIADLAEPIRRNRAVFGSGEPIGVPRRVRRKQQIAKRSAMQATGPREQTIAQLYAIEASQQNAALRSFRQAVLGDALLTPEGVEPWLRTQAGEEGVELWLTNTWVPFPQRSRIAQAINEEYEDIYSEVPRLLGTDGELPQSLLEDVNPMVVRVIVDAAHIDDHLVIHELRCAIPEPTGGEMSMEVVSTGSGVLERLRLLSEHLAAIYRWDAADAALFVLTDLPPRLPVITAEIRVDAERPTTSRITLTIDPTLIPIKVEEYYRHVRREMFDHLPRQLSDKSLELARFAASRPPGETGEDGMRAWNRHIAEDHKDWRYPLSSNFARDCRTARDDLLHPDIHLPRDKAHTT